MWIRERRRERFLCVDVYKMKYQYSILSTIIETEEPVDVLQAFEEEECKNASSQIALKIQDDSQENQCYGVQYITRKQTQLMKNIFFSQKDRTHYLYSSEEDYSKLHLNTNGICSDEVLLELLIVGFYSYMSLQDTLLIHASAVEYQGQSIVFTAPSGTGKTTQAELWAKHKGATILNGDKVFLKKENDGIHAWGSPWKGSSPYAENASAPLRAIVALEQAEENSIRKLEGFEVLEYVVPHVFFPSWDECCEQAVLTFLDQVLGETEVYLLKCRPDEGAVELLASTIKE